MPWAMTEGQEGLIVGWLVYSPQLVAPDGTLGVYRFSLSPIGTYSPPFSLVARTHTLLAAGMPLLEDNLAFHMPNHMRRHVRSDLPLYEKSRINVTFDSDVSAGASFTALNTGTGYGLLRVMEPGERPDPRDVVIYEALPNDLPRVAGIISAAPQTPLSHVNLRAVQDSVPNAFIRDPLDDTGISDLIGSYVRYRVYRDYQYEDKWDLRAARHTGGGQCPPTPLPGPPQNRPRNETSRSLGSPPSATSASTTGPRSASRPPTWPSWERSAFLRAPSPTGSRCRSISTTSFMKHNGFYDDIEGMLADPEFPIRTSTPRSPSSRSCARRSRRGRRPSGSTRR